MNSGFPLSLMMQAQEEEENSHPKLAPDIERIRLQDSLRAYLEPNTFRPGMIVRQKPQATHIFPLGDNDLAIVVEILQEPILVESPNLTSSSPFYRYRADMRVGSIEHSSQNPSREDFCIYHVDSRFFEPAE